MKTLPLPSQDRLRLEYRYDKVTGTLTRIKTGHVVAGCNSGGYQTVFIDGKSYQAHRFIWMLVYGEDPGKNDIDHINGDKQDNRLCNLRLATRSQNVTNKRRLDTPIPGISWDDGWRARCMIDGKRKHLGRFKTKIEALAAICKVADAFHPIHQMEIIS